MADRRLWIGSCWFTVAGCLQLNEPSAECQASEKIRVWVDEDGDGFGMGEPIGEVCAAEAGQAANDNDCDDGSAAMFPGAEEICDGLDNDCAGGIDDGVAKLAWYHDVDADGFGSLDDTESACAAPGPDWIGVTGDCDDGSAAVNPEMPEICDGGIDDDCDGLGDDADPELTISSRTVFHPDEDADGFGDPNIAIVRCEQPLDAVPDGSDCNDSDLTLNPGAAEVCNDRDDDCDALVDDADPTIEPASQFVMYADADGDGHGDPAVEVLACAPSPGIAVPFGDDCDDSDPLVFADQAWLTDGDGDGYGAGAEVVRQCQDPGGGLAPEDRGLDCDDGNAAIHPQGDEVCNGGVDDDCDGGADDQDASVDPGTYTSFNFDGDGDSFGDPNVPVFRCAAGGSAVTNGADCDDGRPLIHPGGIEVCGGRDDDCDLLVDDDDPSIDPSSQQSFFADGDGDGYGDPSSVILACVLGLGQSDNDFDCDDDDPAANLPQSWLDDLDGDGVGSGPSVVDQCLNPGGGLAPEAAGFDCDEGDADIHEGAVDPCSDGIDQDCDGSDECVSCQDWLASGVGGASGVYTILPPGGFFADVYCDQTTDGGGWTLVASTSGTTLDDAGTANAYADLQTLTPAAGHSTVWDGLRSVILDRSDIRFTCKNNVMAAAFDVDLSFYDIGWYREITTGNDNASCFNEDTGLGQDYPPERRNNLNGATRALGDQWNYGYFEGEDTCGDNADFTVDFDDRGMDSDVTDGTDWGEDDALAKCGNSMNGQAWFIFAREL